MKKITPENPYTGTFNLTNCDEEPIHLIQTVQGFAAVLAIDLFTWTIQQVSTNIPTYLGKAPDQVLGQPFSDHFPEHVVLALKKGVQNDDFTENNPIPLSITSGFPQERILIAHRVGPHLIVEVEFANRMKSDFSFFKKVDKAIEKIQTVREEKVLLATVVESIRTITGYDRVMIYKFDEDYNGSVEAESKVAELEPFLGIQYPATDIPKQARHLFLSNRVRMLIDVQEELSFMTPSIHPLTRQPLEVGGCAARGVSPVHLEYLGNMGVRATLSVAIIEDGKLWGLIACHHYQDQKIISYHTRQLIRFMGQLISGHLSLFRAKTYRDLLLKNNTIHAALFKQINEKQDIIEGLTTGKVNILDYIQSEGAVVYYDNKIVKLGKTPDEPQIERVIHYLNQEAEGVLYSTDSLISIFPEEKVYTKDFAGLLAIRISLTPAEYILWFRVPKTKKVTWGGNPDKAIVKSADPTQRLSPRKSFAKWEEIVKNKSDKWQKTELDAAILLLNDIKEVILKRFNELKRLHKELQDSYQELDSFSYSISHDLRSPLRAVEGFSQILLEDYTGQLDNYGIEVVNTIIASVNRMNEFVNDILKVSKLTKEEIIYNQIDLNVILPPIVDDIKNSNTAYRNVEVIIAESLPILAGDQGMVKQLFQNLISNAIKYSSGKTQPKIEISGLRKDNFTIFSVQDNGIGLDLQYKNKIFDLFGRLVSEDEFEGTGVGLSIVKRVVERHGGCIEVESELEKGTVFIISFPIVSEKEFLN